MFPKKVASIHGSAMIIERPEDVVSFWRSGAGTNLVGYPSRNTAFHFPIPLEFVLGAHKQSNYYINGVWLYFASGDGAVIKEIDIYDGHDLLHSIKNLNLYNVWGPWEKEIEPPKPRFYRAIDIVVKVGFAMQLPPPFVQKDFSMGFEAAGIELVEPPS